jgi:hypothetical protein
MSEREDLTLGDGAIAFRDGGRPIGPALIDPLAVVILDDDFDSRGAVQPVHRGDDAKLG